MPQFLILTLPITAFEFLMYHLSVKDGNEKAKKIHFRLIKEHISTVEENNGMYSTDDEDFNEIGNDKTSED